MNAALLTLLLFVLGGEDSPICLIPFVRQFEVSKTIPVPVPVIKHQADGQERLLVYDKKQFFWRELFAQGVVKDRRQRAWIYASESKIIVFARKGKLSNTRLNLKILGWHGNRNIQISVNLSRRPSADVFKLNGQHVTFGQSAVRPPNTYIALRCQRHAVIRRFQLIAHGPELVLRGFGLRFQVFLLLIDRLKLSSHCGELALRGGRLPVHSGSLSRQDAESVCHFPQLFPIYSGLNQYRDKKQKLKDNKWIRPLAGVALVLLSAIPGLPGVQLWYRARFALSGLLLCACGALAFGGTVLALSEPKAEKK
jgi:hypothetical protein